MVLHSQLTDPIVSCTWVTEMDEPYCDKDDGIDFDGVVTDELTITLPETNRSNEGTYTCQLTNGNETHQPCYLKVEGKHW